VTTLAMVARSARKLNDAGGRRGHLARQLVSGNVRRQGRPHLGLARDGPGHRAATGPPTWFRESWPRWPGKWKSSRKAGAAATLAKR
jgi:hypothetical protein